MITEDYVSFETARLLKEKGFNERLLTFYITDEAKKEGCFQLMAFTDDKIDNNHSDHCYLAPTLQMAMKWLREVHNWHIVIERYPDSYYPHIEAAENKIEWSHEVIIGRVFYSSQDIVGKGKFTTYELACEAAILWLLKNKV